MESSSPVQVYHHRPPHHQSVVIIRSTTDDIIRTAPDPSSSGVGENGRPPAVSSSGVLWEPRDPPLMQYSVTQLHHRQPGKSRLEPRRSASLSQADLVAYDGKLLLNLSQSPHRVRPAPQPHDSAASAASRYQDYYETKYEKPVRISGSDGGGTGRQSRPTTTASTAMVQHHPGGVDVDAVWKSRWRSTSPPPAPVDDWLPIKPPQLAWAKPVAPPTVADMPRRPKSSRIPVPMNPHSLARSASGDMDHMIYLERDVPLRERTRSIDRGLAQQLHHHHHHHHNHHQQQQQQQQHSQRIAYKTYEEELADYHGRTGSVDRLSQQQRGRPRTNIRMGTQVGGRSVPVSLERRHSEVGTSASVERRSSSSSRRDSSSNNSSSSRTTNLRRGSSSVEINGEPSSRKNHSNINRVYINGQPSQQPAEEQVILRNQQPPAAIRVTMTDTRSLQRRPTNTNRSAASPPGDVSKNPGNNEPSTIPRMNSKRHGQVQQQPVRPVGIIQPQPPPPSPIHPGSTTVYLAQDQQPSATVGFIDGAVFRKVTPKRIKTDGKLIDDSHHHGYPLYLFLHLSPIQHTIL